MKQMWFLGRFLLAFFCYTIFCTILWERFVLGSIYYCSDTVFPEYLTLVPPHYWSHGTAQGDWIRPGWSDSKISALWYSMVGASVLASAVVATAK